MTALDTTPVDPDAPIIERVDFSDKRGGAFVVISDVRIRESDLSTEQRTSLGLPLATLTPNP
jgi:hypothetical protein